MSFKDQPWTSRFGAMGDQSEAKFEEWATEQGIAFVRYGLDRPPIHVPSLPTLIRYTPDYLTAKGFYEVQGFGRDQLLKLKLDKLGALDQWGAFHDTLLFTYDSHKDRAWVIPITASAFPDMKDPRVGTGVFDGKKPYVSYTADWLTEYGEPL